MHPGYALLPFFLGCVALEALVLWARERRLPEASELLANTGCGLGQLAMRPFYETAIAGLYWVVYEHARMFTLSPASLAAWVVLFLATDLTYYAYHRLSHRVGVMWAWHGVHHQSSAYDLSVSFRLSWLGGPVERLFYVPFAALGFPPAMIVAMTGFSSFYQFFVHTRAIGRLGPLEWIFNTPSHHRVHHGTEAHYRDHNFGGVLCIWDRAFGTYVRESAEPTYGVVEPLRSRSPFVANVRYWEDLLRAARRSVGLRERWAVLAGPPSGAASRAKYADRAPTARTIAYVATQFAASTIGVCALTTSAAPLVGASVLFAIGGTITLGAMLDDRPWARAAEVARWTLACGVASMLATPELRGWVLLATAGSIAWLIAPTRVSSRAATSAS